MDKTHNNIPLFSVFLLVGGSKDGQNVVMEISAGARGLKVVMAIYRLLGIKLHKCWTNFIKHQPLMWSLLGCHFLIKRWLTQSFILLIISNYCICYFSNIISILPSSQSITILSCKEKRKGYYKDKLLNLYPSSSTFNTIRYT